MKALKITLLFIVLAAIGFVLLYGQADVDDSRGHKGSDNKYVSDIIKEIDTLGNMPSNVFSRDYYDKIMYHIEDGYENQLLDSTDFDNDEKFKTLSRIANAKYREKFKEQVFYIFNGSEWDFNSLNFIRKELRLLNTPTYVEPGSPTSATFKKFEDILAKYDEITAHISSCNNFTVNDYRLEVRFPVEAARTKVERTRQYLNNSLENSYVNNCIRLKESLQSIPQKLFDLHFDYVGNKISRNTGKYNNYPKGSEGFDKFNKDITEPLKNEYDSFKNIYGLEDNSFRVNQRALELQLNKDITLIYKHFNTVE